MVTPDYGYAITTAITTVDSLPTSCTSEPQSTVAAGTDARESHKLKPRTSCTGKLIARGKWESAST
jgi:hypothetical protein